MNDVATTAATSPSPTAWVFAAIYLIVLFAGYWLPTIIAFRRHKRNAAGILATNFLLGWTVIGWIICLIWSTLAEPPATARPS